MILELTIFCKSATLIAQLCFEKFKFSSKLRLLVKQFLSDIMVFPVPTSSSFHHRTASYRLWLAVKIPLVIWHVHLFQVFGITTLEETHSVLILVEI